ncbi:hypothetical protein BJ684DRAFT_17599 [Piptocephalis cylindrospora]|uniref:Uncharacterized protein n=1 Tax=Piptocephalis cylindrospora TaxID=1907219 RepID=A0A4P9XZP0_9FUNG|nr:hypothetical protein BJ684DRAFT_17599 [Piptocephalis cylindrospora]|eukprot:RKP11854.1 hypothetical protein BJ684DRAFT_17599 [Piptocephalis cylindrospora]
MDPSGHQPHTQTGQSASSVDPSGSGNPQSATPVLDPTTALQHTFRNAARTVTQLYKESLVHSENAYARGYEQCLQDLLDAMPHFSPFSIPGSSASSGSSNASGERMIAAEELLGYIRSKHDSLQRRDGSFTAHTKALFGDAEFTFTPPTPQMPPTGTSSQNAQIVGQKRGWGHGGFRESHTYPPAAPAEKEEMDKEMEEGHHFKRYRGYRDEDEDDSPSRGGRFGGGGGHIMRWAERMSEKGWPRRMFNQGGKEGEEGWDARRGTKARRPVSFKGDPDREGRTDLEQDGGEGEEGDGAEEDESYVGGKVPWVREELWEARPRINISGLCARRRWARRDMYWKNHRRITTIPSVPREMVMAKRPWRRAAMVGSVGSIIQGYSSQGGAKRSKSNGGAEGRYWTD